MESAGLLKGKTAIVTGGASGLGREIARAFAAQDAATVVVTDVTENPREGGTPTVASIREDFSCRAEFVKCDV